MSYSKFFLLSAKKQQIVTKHGFHMVKPSWQPMLTSIGLTNLVESFLLYFHSSNTMVVYGNLSFALFFLIWCVWNWFSEIIYEGTYEGHHTKKVQRGLELGMILFILSEIMFFFSFFWAFFHASLAPAYTIGGIWPPAGIQVFTWYGVPLANTLLLLLSGVWVTAAHRFLMVPKALDKIIVLNNFYNIYGSLLKLLDNKNLVSQYYLYCFRFLLGTVFLGIAFTGMQGLEYCHSQFSINDSVYGSLFYMLTGFHGLHVIIGTIFLFVMLCRLVNRHFTKSHHLGFIFAAWYWHFVDVVWLFLFIIVYCWGS
jgi:cytochrome c oxidase subunit 3